MTFGTLFAVAILLILIVHVVVRLQRSRRFQRAIEFEDEYYEPASGRTAGPKRFDWTESNEGWGSSLEKMEAELENLKERAEGMPDTAENSQPTRHDWSDLAPTQRKIKAMSVLNQQRGEHVRIMTAEGRIHQGEVVTLAGTKVMLRDKASQQVGGVTLEDIVKIY